MKSITFFLNRIVGMPGRLACCGLSVTLILSAGSAHGQSDWVSYGQSGLLHNTLDSRGDRILNFSEAGYRNGEELPDVASIVTPDRFVNVAPGAGDDLQRVQNAINQVSQLSLNSSGFRGVVQLTAGEFQLSDSLTIAASGVVLKGVGDGSSPSNSTVFRSTTTLPIAMINVNSPNHSFHNLNPASNSPRVGITDKVVPGGATSFNVASPTNFNVGDEVVVYRNATQDWVDSLGSTANQDATNQRFDHYQERKIVRIEGSRVFLNAPLAHSIGTFGTTGEVYRYTDNRIRNVGIEGIRGVSDFDATKTGTVGGVPVFTDENHADDFISFNHVRDAWARDVTGQHLRNSTVVVVGVSRSITVTDAASVDPVSIVTGSRRYSFEHNGGQFLLFKNLTSDGGRHDFSNNSTFNGFNRGPNVYFNATATNSFSASGAHQNYSTGTLLDNVSDDDSINVRDRGTTANQGWAGSGYVVWNSDAGSLRVHNPPGSRNYVIGTTGNVISDAGTGTYDSLGQRVSFNDPENPLDSLYVAQVLESQRFPEIERREYWIGDYDELENDGASDQVFVDPDWLSAINSSSVAGQSTIGFDEVQADSRVPFTINFDLADDEQVVSAFLSIATRRDGINSDNDLLFLDSLTDPLSFSAAEWGPIYDGDLQVLTLELFGDLAFLQDGQLNGLLTNDRAIDWVNLQVNVAPISAVLGDFDNDGDVDADDIDFYSGQLGQAATGGLEQLDLDGDGQVTLADHDLHINTLAETSNGLTGTAVGDINLDGVVDVFGDGFTLLENLGSAGDVGFASGDLNADQVVDIFGDGFRLLSTLGLSNSQASPATVSVPEPANGLLALVAMGGLVARRVRW